MFNKTHLMIKISTLLNDSSQVTKNKKVGELTPGPQAVKMLMNYSRALQVIDCQKFETCFIVLN
jgi:hypothetical protein